MEIELVDDAWIPKPAWQLNLKQSEGENDVIRSKVPVQSRRW